MNRMPAVFLLATVGLSGSSAGAGLRSDETVEAGGDPVPVAVTSLATDPVPSLADTPAGVAPTPSTISVDTSLAPLRGKSRWGGSGSAEAPFPLALDGEDALLAVTFHVLLPGESLAIEAPPGTRPTVNGGRLVERAAGRWSWHAPEDPGIRWLRMEGEAGETIDVALLVAHPARRISGGSLNGYRIGTYPSAPLRGDPAYVAPAGFVEVHPDDEDIRISPHFTIGEFLCKQRGDPRYLALSRPLLIKLELLLDAANASGIRASSLTVMSGYRTPFYNRSIGNTTDYSRHLWGDAADVYIDDDGDGEMDDLNGDGQRNIADARHLARIVDRLSTDPPEGYESGGLASYRRNAAHGPFVHVDSRGSKARW